MTLLLIGTVVLAAAVVVLWVERARAVRLCAAAVRDRDDALENVESLRERLSIADMAYGACRAELDGLQSVRREAGFKAARTRKARKQAVQTVAEVSDGR